MKFNWKLLAITMLVGAAYTLSGCALECLDQFDCAEQSKKDGGKRYACVSNKCQVMVIPETGGGDGSTGGGDGTTGGGDGTTGGGDGSMGGGDGTTGGGDADAGTGGGTATGGGDADAGTGGGTATGGGTGTDAGTGGGTGTDAGMTDAGMDMDAGTDAGTPATCSVCNDATCGTNPNVSTCAAGETLCTTQATQGAAGAFLATRACSTPAAAQTAVANNPPECADFTTAPLTTVCTFACDGVNFPDCNHPPQAMPDAGVWDGGF